MSQELLMSQKNTEGHATFTFSLTQTYSDRIDQLTTLMPRSNRSHVVKAAIEAFESLSVEQKKVFLQMVISR